MDENPSIYLHELFSFGWNGIAFTVELKTWFCDFSFFFELSRGYIKPTDRQQEFCPICDSKLRSKTGPYCLNDLFELWAPVQFSEGTLTEHFKQSSYTQLYSCPECKLGIFLPQIIGTANFYLDLSRNDSNHYYVDEKWDFEQLEGIHNDLKYIIPFKNIKTIIPKNEDYTYIILRNDKKLILGKLQDVSSKNEGVIIISSNSDSKFIDWEEVDEINFE